MNFLIPRDVSFALNGSAVFLCVLLGVCSHVAYAQQALTAQQPSPEEVMQTLQRQQQTIADQQEQIDALASFLETFNQRVPAAQAGGLRWEGYGVINYQAYDFYENSQDDVADHRARTDLERIVFAPTYEFDERYAFVAEIEFEHGGTGSAIEFEQEEAGEFEGEIEKGGEVVLEQAHLRVRFSPRFNLRFGEVVVPFGMVNSHHQPSQYFTQQRSLAETQLVPSVWHETGIEVYGVLGALQYQAQVISALDSSGFSGDGFVQGGMQGKVEFDNADDLALVVRADYLLGPGVLFGGSVYYGDSSGNRPRKNLDVSAPVTLAEVHGRYGRGVWTVRGQYMVGFIANAAAVTRANYTTYNASELGISKTPVGSKAVAYFGEVGYDFLPMLGLATYGRFDVFARYEAYDSHVATEGSISKVPRYDRSASSSGLNYHPRPGVIFKAVYSQRDHAGSTGNTQNTYGLGLGFEF